MGGSNKSGCKIDPLQLALIGTFLTMVGDFTSFLGVFADIQSSSCEDKDQKQTQINPNKIYAENKIKELEYEIYKLKKEIDDFNT
ncbi:hypothetical protein [Proteiniborus sp. MB09-C3]|uniref:hypothetical protein n=1 Tax=Proteiniborus sp. MB09-C3 TaxID=3050072 RepID=UPI002554DE56|nr:hypothetical protein [Proteiniborus sp. MB09-C3]WIV10635.1 hypothetical protein QO263_10745 [Proteiniborus sp. MB09-C3]